MEKTKVILLVGGTENGLYHFVTKGDEEYTCGYMVYDDGSSEPTQKYVRTDKRKYGVEVFAYQN